MDRDSDIITLFDNGMAAKANEVARNLKALGTLSLEAIAKVTGLTSAQVKAL